MNITSFIDEQLAQWPEARAYSDDLTKVSSKYPIVNGIPVQVQYNPAREGSTMAKVDTKSIKKRPCFLCTRNRPKEQISLSWKTYHILLNPYPILPLHLTIATQKHLPQAIRGKIGDMLELSKLLEGFIVWYNGPQSGASAPDHFHFQAVEAGHTPLEKIMDNWMRLPASSISGKVALRENISFSGTQLLLSGYEQKALCNVFMKIYQMLIDEQAVDKEPKMNVFCRYTHRLWQLQIIPRRAHRPKCFFAEGDAQLLISPGAIDMAGIIITPREKDFEWVTSEDIEQIYKEVAIFDLLNIQI